MFEIYQYKAVTLFEFMQNPAAVDWIRQSEISLPDQVPPGRYPSPAEMQDILENTPGIKTCYLVGKLSWQVTIMNLKDIGWAILAVKGFSGDLEVPYPFYFVGGWDELIVQVTSAIAKRCGPFVLLHESGAPPLVVL